MAERAGDLDGRESWRFGWRRELEIWMAERAGDLDGRESWRFGWQREFEILLICVDITNMYETHRCQSHVPVLQYSYCMPFQSSLSLYQGTVTNMYGSQSSHCVRRFKSESRNLNVVRFTMADVSKVLSAPILRVNQSNLRRM